MCMLLVVGAMGTSGHMVSLFLQASLDLLMWWLQVPRNRVEVIKVSRGLELELVPLCPWHSIAKSQNQADSQGGEIASAPL